MATITRYEYNKDKQILNVIRPDGGIIETIYDTVGCGSCGGTLGRPKRILFDRGSIDFKYSASTGLIDTLISPEDTASYTYDGSLLTSVSGTGNTAAHLYYDYDNNFRVTDQELWVTNPNNEDFDALNFYDYDQDGLLTTLTLFQYTIDGGWWYGGSMGIEHDPATGRVNGTVCANVTTSQDYDSSGAISYFEADYSGSSIFQTSYQRDSLNRISILTEVNQGKMTVKKYAYDVVGRLSQVWRNDTLISTYSYDPNGNRIARRTPSKIDSGFYDAQDRMLSYGNVQYIYSRNGELQKKIAGTDTTSYVYDYFGNLLSVQLPNNDLIEYLIDGQNRRIGKKVNGAIVKKWIYEGQLSPIAELDSAGNVTAEFVGSLMIKNGNTYQLITDHLGSVRLVVDVNSGTVAQQIEYDEFGNVLLDSNRDFQPFAFAGGLYDAQTKLTRFGTRDYDAMSGRWTCKDQIGFGGKVSNLYEYTINNPINKVDRSGKQTLSVGVTIDGLWGPFNGNLTAGIAIDLQGNLGVYWSWGGGLGVGERLSGGINISVSNAKTVCDLSGPFANASGGGGLGAYGSANSFTGMSIDGQVTGWGITLGIGEGAVGSVTMTVTYMSVIGDTDSQTYLNQTSSTTVSFDATAVAPPVMAPVITIGPQ